MHFKAWEVPVEAEWYRSNELQDLRFDRSGLTIKLAEEESGRTWTVRFETVQGFRMTTEECAGPLLASLPERGAFFEADDSQWLKDLGKGEIEFLRQSRHFVIGCYDEIIEVVAHDASIAPG
jgi:hypothetical protein